MEIKRTKGPAVFLAQPKNRRFAGLGQQCPIQLRTKGLAVNDGRFDAAKSPVLFCFSSQSTTHLGSLF